MATQQLLGRRNFIVPVASANQLVNLEIDLPSDMVSITGFALTADRKDLAWLRARVGITVAGVELLQERMPASESIYGASHPARTFAFGELPLANTDRRLVVRVLDQDNPTIAFAPYKIEVILTHTKSIN